MPAGGHDRLAALNALGSLDFSRSTRPTPRPVPDHLADIQVPVFYLGAGGGFGEYGLYTTTLVGSSDVTTLVVRELDPARQDEDYGHGDLLYAGGAPAVAWEPLAGWIESH